MQPQVNSINILLVEDDEIDVQNVQRTFKHSDMPINLHVAMDGFEALDILYGRHGKPPLKPAPQLIILDINMPKMNGIDFLKTLRSNHEFKKIKILILTTSNAEEDKSAMTKLKVDGYILKPVQTNKLLNYCSLLLENVS